MTRLTTISLSLLLLAACGDGESNDDAGTGLDAGTDAGVTESDAGGDDAGTDAGTPGDDAGTDASAPGDDAGPTDAGTDAAAPRPCSVISAEIDAFFATAQMCSGSGLGVCTYVMSMGAHTSRSGEVCCFVAIASSADRMRYESLRDEWLAAPDCPDARACMDCVPFDPPVCGAGGICGGGPGGT